MKIKYLIPLILIFALFSTQSWAPPTSRPQGKKEKEEVSRELAKPEEDESALGAVGGAPALGIDLSKCDLNPAKQKKIRFKGKDGKDRFICKGEAACGGTTVPVSCKAKEKDACPTTNECSSPDYGELKENWAANCTIIQFRLKDGYRFTKQIIEKCKVLKGYTRFPGTGLGDIPIYIISGDFFHLGPGEREPQIDPRDPRDPNRIKYRRHFSIELRRELQSDNYNLALSVGDMLEYGTAYYLPVIVNKDNGLIIDTKPVDPIKELTIQLSLGQKILPREEKFKNYEILPRASGDPLNIDLFIKK